jgi:hypothetical protein
MFNVKKKKATDETRKLIIYFKPHLVAFNGTSGASGNSAKCRNCDENYNG